MHPPPLPVGILPPPASPPPWVFDTGVKENVLDEGEADVGVKIKDEDEDEDDDAEEAAN